MPAAREDEEEVLESHRVVVLSGPASSSPRPESGQRIAGAGPASQSIGPPERRVYATRHERFVPVTIDQRLQRAVRHPLDRPTADGDEVDCQSVRYGYAIPLSVLPLDDNPDYAELLLDESSSTTDSLYLNQQRLTRYQETNNHHQHLHHHHHQQQLIYNHNRHHNNQNNHLKDYYKDNRSENSSSNILPPESIMAATAKHEQLRGKYPTDSSGEEDIAAIAKQISDHAEAIYQTWKSRGLAPTEILNCHSNATAADKFGSALTPASSATSGMSAKRSASPATSPTAVEILAQSPGLDNNNLEKLVNNFVVEDRARIAAATRQRSPAKTLPSSIQFALQKFERNSTPHTSPVKTPTGAISQSIVKPQIQQKTVLTSPTSGYPNKPSHIVKPQLSPKTPASSHHNEIFLETIETTFPADLTPSKILVQQKRPVSSVITSHASSATSTTESSSATSGLTTWPLKNKIVEPRRVPATIGSACGVVKVSSPVKDENFTGLSSRTSPSANYNVNAYLDEVAREEERLINALKTGAVITDEPALDRGVNANTVVNPIAGRQKPAIKKEKPKVDPVKPIIIGHSPVGCNAAIPGNATTTPTSAILVNSVITSPIHNSGIIDAKILSKDDLSSMSMVDYAKVRYRAAQQSPSTQQRLDDQKTSGSPLGATEQLVSTTRTKFEPEAKDSKDTGSKDERDFVTSRWGPRVNSPRPRIDQVPHPELTTQQKQHIRAAAATGTGNNPVRPFLTRGSVAERVLIFEKCPSELLLDKRGPRQPAINTWRNGHEVQSKAQVIR